MDATTRRERVFKIINKDNSPVSASTLAKELSVSRQVIVGDVAILRAQGHEIIATARGYMIPEFRESNQHVGKIACCHTAENTKEELYTIVDLGATVVNVIVEHELYGEITGQLNIKTRDDADIFVDRVQLSEARLLSALTMGVHLHTIACRNKAHFEQVYHALNSAGFLVQT
ncbi:MAG: transcription repressor NadR [Defluviitaleaceae bacterium]|nr:transcription repressor NadR [Defluviitaleaceae bacterium]